MNTDMPAAWVDKFEQRNQESSDINRQLDVVILGDSLLIKDIMAVNEQQQQQSEWTGLPDVYPDLFTIRGGGQIDGISLESGGERVSSYTTTCMRVSFATPTGLRSKLTSSHFFLVVHF